MRPELKTKVKAIIKASKLSFVIHRGTLQHVLVSTFERPFDHEQIAGLPVIPRSRASDQNALPISAISHYFSGAQGRRIYHSARGSGGTGGGLVSAPSAAGLFAVADASTASIALAVSEPISPSTSSPCLAWKSATTLSVLGP